MIAIKQDVNWVFKVSKKDLLGVVSEYAKARR